MPYRAPIDAYMRLLRDVVGYDAVAETERFAEANRETVAAVLGEAGKLCEEVLAPLQRNGDLDPARLENGVVRTSKGFADGYAALAEGGWIATSAPEEYGGMGLPLTVTTCVNDMLGAACLALQLNPLMSQGQIDALEHHASDDLKTLYLPKLISGEWAGTMNLTEPQAGSDVGALSSKAVPNDDGTYAITGQKIYISWGDNDFSENVCHLVLARLPDGVPGTKGISLFLVPKLIPDENGNPGVANDLHVVSLEHKMGLHGSPTCVMQYDGAKGWLVGEPHDGMRAMFTMMNNARLGVGVQGVSVAEGALQHALAYAQERKQGRSPEGTIIGHADVRRMLATMRAETFAARAIALSLAVAIDLGKATGEADWKSRAALLTPIAKAFGTETGIKVANLGVQVHGGMGYVEETGAAQYLRDVRVTAIYEGTNGIQAMDLVGRKMMDGGEAIFALLDEVESGAEAARGKMPELAEPVWQAAESLRETTEALVAREMGDRFGSAVPYLMGFARVLGAHYHLRAAMAAPDSADARLAGFYIQRLLPEHTGLLAEARAEVSALANLKTEDLVA
ncbi:acyl-CoA dehydrogenase [Mameliella sp. CS4]|uniref:acyl-CoA dehydrogenase n=1 Tax=Mameliella sp. CS4 TaxID=2862329 RepID=UPI001C5EC492|nr:acyl-CoA dehydrogenase [Mameliella sp. CS4]MBW4982858.1 acyl-CoA dehydrogenase [Mameliella sp. CS4]